jgi:ribonucleoside-triphosphate reductase
LFVDVDRHGTWTLPTEFVEAYRQKPVAWGFGALSWVTYKRTYSRNGEAWWQTCRRVIEGMMTVQRIHCLERGLAWDDSWARDFAQGAYDRLWHFKWTPPGRGLWIMGTRHMYERGGAALNNCGFVSTKDLAHDYAAPFTWLMSMSMLGVGVGFDTRGRGRVEITPPQQVGETHVIGDTREAWVAALRRLLRAYAGGGTLPVRWDYSKIRRAGSRLESFGGFSSGPGPVREMIESLVSLYESYVGRRVDAALIVDTMNIVGRCVVAGGIRRSAEIAFGQASDSTFLDLKMDQDKVREYRWVSNNSVFAEKGMDYADVAHRTIVNGEPGYLWLENAQAYGRMNGAPTWADEAAEGSNPCCEQTLCDRELCCLVETYPARHDDFEDFIETVRIAYGYAKTVTLVATHDERTNEVMTRNRRIGCSMTGIVQAIDRLGYRRFFDWCDKAYGEVLRLDDEYARWFQVPRSVKRTSVKPSGTVSLLAGATPGVHWDHAPYYIRRIRVSENHPLVDMCRTAGYPMEADAYSDNTIVISFPVHVAGMQRRKADVSMREKIDLAAQMQRWWSDNQVSCTAEFDPDTEAEEVPHLLRAYEDRLKALVMLPSRRHGYAQPPYEAVSREAYKKMTANLKPLKGDLPCDFESRFCDTPACEPT